PDSAGPPSRRSRRTRRAARRGTSRWPCRESTGPGPDAKPDSVQSVVMRDRNAGAAPATRRERSQRRRRSAFITSLAGVTGELLLTAGVFVLLFLGWQLWVNDA